MCVIFLLNKGKKLSNLIINQAAKANDDGFGVAWVQNGQVQLKKSMKLEDVIEHIHDSRYRRLVHFRIATHGTTSEMNCHPFWLETRPRCAIAHNGTWSQFGEAKSYTTYLYRELNTNDSKKETKSDTYECVEYLNRVIKSYKINHITKGMLNFLYKSLGSKAAILTPDNAIHIWGTFTEIKPGILASNTSWHFPARVTEIKPAQPAQVASTPAPVPSTPLQLTLNTTPPLIEAKALPAPTLPTEFGMSEIFVYLNWLADSYKIHWDDFPKWQIAKLLAKALGTTTSYAFRPFQRERPKYFPELRNTIEKVANDLDNVAKTPSPSIQDAQYMDVD